ncbi:MAG TPA: hypothetical protein VJG90_06755 [Candidatus Nanoarchaeia archaeon]|nr:hypothetical protein [Candidatus Nanoarchaeia archaeon]
MPPPRPHESLDEQEHRPLPHERQEPHPHEPTHRELMDKLEEILHYLRQR